MNDIAPAALRRILRDAGLPEEDAARVRFVGADDLYSCHFMAGVSTGVALAAAGLALPGPARDLTVDCDHASLMSEGYRHVRLDGRSVAAPRDPLTGFYETRYGRVIFLHLNFPHHRDRALAVLQAQPDRESIAARVRTWERDALDASLAEAGAVAAPALSFSDWDAADQGRAVAQSPLIEILRIGDAPPRPFARMQDLRVVDLTRVLAGPTCGRFLAEAGADVTRVEHPVMPDLLAYRLDANRDKHEITLDLADAAARDRMRDMLARADVFLQGYRPGAMARFGLDPESVASAHPGVVCATLSAYGSTGPWAGRRGFDSVIQAATGLAIADGEGAPRLLPTSPLDYGAGFLLAFGIETALRRRAREGGSWLVRTSLARVALWLRSFRRPTAPAADAQRLAAAIAGQSVEMKTPMGLIRCLRSAMTVSA